MIRIVAVGKKHESWVVEGIKRYEERLRRPFVIEWLLLPHSAREGDSARQEETERILAKLSNDDFVILLDERGKNISSPALVQILTEPLERARDVVIVVGDAYGVNEELFKRASFVWSLSLLVFPHQLVRLIVTEQLYRAQEIAAARPYHHR